MPSDVSPTCEKFQPLPAAFGEDDDGDAAAVVFAFQAAYYLFDVVQTECLEGFGAECAAPCVKNLYDLRAVLYLAVEVLGNGAGVGV